MTEKRGEEASPSAMNKLILRKAVIKRINQIKTKAFISEREVYDLVRSFFKKHLGIDYEFTREELIKELRRIYLTPDLQSKVDKLFKEVSEVEHNSKPFQREELERILDEFQEVIEELIGSHYKKEKTFIKKLKDSLHNFFSRKHETMLEVDESVLSENERVIVKMNMLLDNSKRWSDMDLNKSKQAYKELLEIYNSLDPERKKVYFKPVNELFQMIRIKDKV